MEVKVFRDKVIFLALMALMFVLTFWPKAHADTVGFACKNEEAINEIAESLNQSQHEADETAEPYIALGICQYFDERLFIYVVHVGTTYGKITVVGVSDKQGTFPTMWSMKESKDINLQVGSI